MEPRWRVESLMSALYLWAFKIARLI
jgi:hypothetical protein